MTWCTLRPARWSARRVGVVWLKENSSCMNLLTTWGKNHYDFWKERLWERALNTTCGIYFCHIQEEGWHLQNLGNSNQKTVIINNTTGKNENMYFGFWHKLSLLTLSRVKMIGKIMNLALMGKVCANKSASFINNPLINRVVQHSVSCASKIAILAVKQQKSKMLNGLMMMFWG